MMPHDAPSCVPNIGARGTRQRRTSGLVALGAAVMLAIALLALDAPRWSRLVVSLPLVAAGLGIFQASEKTWVRLASRGLRDMDGGEEPIIDPDELGRVRSQARRVWAKTLLLAAGLTMAFLAAPL